MPERMCVRERAEKKAKREERTQTQTDTDRQNDRQTNKETERQRDRQTERQVERQADRQTDRHLDASTNGPAVKKRAVLKHRQTRRHVAHRIRCEAVRDETYICVEWIEYRIRDTWNVYRFNFESDATSPIEYGVWRFVMRPMYVYKMYETRDT